MVVKEKDLCEHCYYASEEACLLGNDKCNPIYHAEIEEEE